MCKLFIGRVWLGGDGRRNDERMKVSNKRELRNDMSGKPFQLNHRIPLPGWKNMKPSLALLLWSSLWKLWWRIVPCCAVPAQSWISFSMWTFMSHSVKLKYYFFQISAFWPLLSDLFRKKQHCPHLPYQVSPSGGPSSAPNTWEVNLPSQAWWLALGFFSACCCLLVDPCHGMEHN